jgi:multidrug efflux pump subunit AcrA (membrane-fusion protein)
MKSKLVKLCSLLVLAAFVLGACGGTPAAPAGQPAEATDIPAIQSNGEVMAEGRIVPRQSVELAFASNGQLEEVLVPEGAMVKAGEVIARLGNRESLESSVASAELDL